MKKSRLAIISMFLVVFSLTATSLSAERGGGGHGGGGDRGDRGGGRSFDRGDRGGGRSFDRGDRGGGRSFDRGDGGRSFEMRSGDGRGVSDHMYQERSSVAQPQRGMNIQRDQGRTTPDRGMNIQRDQGRTTPDRGDVQQFFRSHPTDGVKPVLDKGQSLRGQGVNVDRSSIQKIRGGAVDQKAMLRNRDYQHMGNRVRDNVRNHHPDRDNWFRHDYWDRNHIRPPYYHYDRNWWAWATVGGVAAWLSWDASPYYYYGYYDNNAWVPTSQSLPPIIDYNVQVQSIENQPVATDTTEWMPLGVFSFTQDSDQGEEAVPAVFLQLALSKDGLISGTYIDSSAGNTYEIQGLVDQATQRAAWKVKGLANSPIFETGVFNLSQDEAPARIYNADGSGQDIVLIRLQQP